MAKFIVKGKVKYQGKYYTSGEVVEVDAKHVKEFKAHGWQIADKEPHKDGNDLSKLTNKELEALLTEKGIAFTAGAKKADLLALLA